MTAERIKGLLISRGKTLCVAESLTGGALAAEIVRVPGVSGCFLGGVVAYQDAVKRKFLGVRAETLNEHTAVSAPCAREMARGAREAFGSDYAIATTGYAGPDGEAPGSVYIALSGKKGEKAYHIALRGGRNAVRGAAVQIALYLLKKELCTDGEEGIDEEYGGRAGKQSRE